MRNVKTPKYRIELSCVSFTNKRREVHSFAFDGRPTLKRAIEYRDGMNASFNTHNSHLRGCQSDYNNVQVINQKTGAVVVEYKAPMFATC